MVGLVVSVERIRTIRTIVGGRGRRLEGWPVEKTLRRIRHVRTGRRRGVLILRYDVVGVMVEVVLWIVVTVLFASKVREHGAYLEAVRSRMRLDARKQTTRSVSPRNVRNSNTRQRSRRKSEVRATKAFSSVKKSVGLPAKREKRKRNCTLSRCCLCKADGKEETGEEVCLVSASSSEPSNYKASVYLVACMQRTYWT